MHSIEQKFKTIQDKNPLASTIIVFGRAVRGSKVKRESVDQLFKKLVDKDDYQTNTREAIIDWMLSL
jgi:hypothetical protein